MVGNEKDEYAYLQKVWRSMLDTSIRKSEENRVLIVFSAGNINVDDDDSYLFPDDDMVNPENWETNVIIVGGSKPDHKRYDVGGWIGSTMGDVVDIVAPAQEVGFFAYDTDENIECYSGHGTSYAAPMVAGTASLIWTLRNNLSVKQVKEIIVSSSNKKRIKDWPSNKQGIGLLDIGAALKKAVFYGVDPSFNGAENDLRFGRWAVYNLMEQSGICNSLRNSLER